MRKLFILSAMMRRDEAGRVDMSLHQGYRLTETREEAIGSFVDACKILRPDFSIAQVIDMEIDPEHVGRAAQEQAKHQTEPTFLRSTVGRWENLPWAKPKD